MGRKPIFAPGNAKGKAEFRRMRRKPRAPKSRKAITALVKSVISREEETKFRSQAPIINVAYNSAITNADIISCLPRLVQTQPNDPGNIFERNGRIISARKLNIKCMVNLTSSITRSSAVVVHYYVLTHKSLKHFPDLATQQDISTKLFKTGDFNENYGFDGVYLNTTFPINDSEYVCLKRGKFLLGKNTGTIQDSTTGGNQPMYGNHICKMLNFDIKCPKKLVYDQDSNTPRTVYYPNNFAPFIVFGYIHQDQSVADVTNQDISITLRHSLWYDDA
jgi:hypothetical protein